MAITFFFTKKFFNQRIAAITSMLYSVSPFTILYSRKMWNPDLSFPFIIIVMYSLFSLVVGRKSIYIIPLFLSYAVVIQIQPITIFLAPILLYYVLKEHGLIKIRDLLLGIFAGIASLVPFIYGQLNSNSGDVNSFFLTFSYFHFNHLNPQVIGSLASLTSGSGFDYVLGQSARAFYSSIFYINDFFFVENLILYAGIAFLVGVVILGVPRNRLDQDEEKQRKAKKYTILLMWIILPTLILLFFNPPYGLGPYEIMMFVPANFLVVGILFDYPIYHISNLNVFRRRNMGLKIGKAIIVAIIVFIILIQVGFDLGFNSFLSHYGGTSGDYEIGVQYKIQVASFIAQNSNGSSFTISYNFTPGQIGLEYYYLLSMYDKTPSTSANLHYIVVNSLASPNKFFLSQLSDYRHKAFGPLAIYFYDESNSTSIVLR